MALDREDVVFTIEAQDRATAVFERMKAQLAELGIEARIASAESSRSMDDMGSHAHRAADDVGVSARDISGSFNTINNVVGGVTPSITAQFMKIIGGMSLLGAAAAATSAVAGAGLAALPLVFAGVGALMVKSAVKTNAQLKAEFADAGHQISTVMAQAAAPMVGMFLSIAQDAADAFKQMGPDLHEAFATAAPQVATLASGLLALVQNVLPGMNAAMKASMPAVNALAGGFAAIGTGLGGFFQNLSAGVQGGAAGLGSLLSLVAQVLPMIGAGLAAISGPASQALAVLVKFVLQLMSSLGAGLKPVLDALLPVFAGLLNALMPLLPAIGQLIAAFAPAIAQIGGALVPIISQLVGVFVQLLPSVTPLIAPLLSLLSPIVTMIGPLLTLAAAFGQALMPVIAALLPIIQKLQDVISGQLGAALLSIGKAIIPILPYLGTLVQIVGTALVQALQILMPPLAQLISSGLGALLSAIAPLLPMIGEILAPLLVSLAKLLAAVLQAVMPLLAPLIQLAGVILQGLATVIVWLVQNAIAPLISWIADHLQPAIIAVGNWFVWLWQQVIVPAWQAIVQAFGNAWNWIYQYVIQPIIDYFHRVGDAFTWLWQSVVVPVWDGIQKAIGAAWNWLSQYVFGPIGDAIGALGGAFKTTAGIIGDAWKAIQTAAEAPIRFVVDTIYNNGIRTVWNAIADVFHGKDLNPVSINFATGGTVPGYAPGQDTVHAMLSPGEGVLIPQAVRGLGGPGAIDSINRSFGGRGASGVGSHFADGGVIGDIFGAIGTAAGAVGNAVGGALNGLKNAVLGGLSAAATPVIRGIENAARGFLGTTGFGGLIDSGVDWLGSGILSFLAGQDKTAQAAAANANATPGAFPGTLAGWVSAAMAAVGVSGADWLNGLETIAMYESSGNPNAQNNTDVNAQNGDPSRGLMQTIMSTFEAYRLGSLPDNIFDPVANVAAAIRYIISRYGGIGGVPGLVSLAHGGAYVGYDSGGWLEPGLTLAYNGTGRREAITSPSGAGPAGAGGGVHLHVEIENQYGTFDQRYVEQLWDQLGRHAATWALPAAGVHIRR
ncbi:hypothetical protein SCMU_18410 [Sinomonas cyclohexanicum]|uniref:Transglycosylase SLT domain-containing protein n=1 Tax=Sinomonas cyclohexanicum TaxID=322009 RepID=A0ABN6FHA5_SINCY|nr:transglycosylase SLT domain-containing protein [Corynebacterium cyclohexanicum]BCT75999.1 hypothetical protein SCMU_18410 [Corynebacterium cyclohexanicum]